MLCGFTKGGSKSILSFCNNIHSVAFIHFGHISCFQCVNRPKRKSHGTIQLFCSQIIIVAKTNLQMAWAARKKIIFTNNFPGEWKMRLSRKSDQKLPGYSFAPHGQYKQVRLIPNCIILPVSFLVEDCRLAKGNGWNDQSELLLLRLRKEPNASNLASVSTSKWVIYFNPHKICILVGTCKSKPLHCSYDHEITYHF